MRKRIKKDEKDNHIYHILNMFVNVMNDLFRNIIINKNIENFITNADELVDYTNEQLCKINKRYKSVDRGVLIKI